MLEAGQRRVHDEPEGVELLVQLGQAALIQWGDTWAPGPGSRPASAGARP